MADIIDQGQDAEQQFLTAALENREVKQPLPFIKQCHYCQEPLAEPRRFCDADCRDDYEAEQQFKAGKRA